jgi:hypothetical protein
VGARYDGCAACEGHHIRAVAEDPALTIHLVGVAIVASTWADELCTTNSGIGGVSSPFEIDAFLSYFR